ncbi:Oxidoreductase sirO [Cladobotryum mycophilum]|uniref:Oxidoreductase sirO n=1 Tax=Cladobotryum mycophilum TaxID=491253 RepID=A0ABR0SQ70_9HYPO
MASAQLKLVFGAAGVSTGASYSTPEKIDELFETLDSEGINQLDTAQIYGDSEEQLGKVKAHSRFIIDTKHGGGFVPGSSTREQVVARGLESFKKLGADKVNIFYIHAPDAKLPIADTLAGIDELYRAGKFEKFGLSNFSPAEVEEVISISKEKGYVLPTVYQGNYNAVARRVERDLFPVLRKNNIAFYAYSPIAGGFLTKTSAQLTEGNGGTGRWSKETAIGKLYHNIYNKPTFLQALDKWGKIAEEAGVSKAELAYRWVAYHSYFDSKSDALVIGASSVAQLKQTVAGLKKGPLPDAIVKQVADIWDIVEEEALTNNYDVLRAD